MTLLALVLRNLLYHLRGNIAVFVGVALGSAVLTGALLVGDSLRGSLRDLTLDQLGWIDSAMTPGRFFRQDLKLPAEHAASVLMLRGSAVFDKPEHDHPKFGPSVWSAPAQIVGVDVKFWNGAPAGNIAWDGDQGTVAINQSLADDLHAKVGDSISLNLQKSDAIPRETLLGKRKSDDVVAALTVKVAEILPDRGLGRFNLQPTPAPARNVFVPRGFLQDRLNLAGKVNAVFLRNLRGGKKSLPDYNKLLSQELTLADWGLKLLSPDDRARDLVKFLDPRNDDGKLKKLKWTGRIPDDLAKKADGGILTLAAITEWYRVHRPYFVLESDQLYLGPVVEKALRDNKELASKVSVHSLVYLADHLSVNGKETPYAVVAAVDPDGVPNSPEPLKPDEIRLVDWPGNPLAPTTGDPVEIAFYSPNERNHLELATSTFEFAGRVPMTGAADDPDWTPPFQGLTDKTDISDWDDPPFPPYSTKLLMKRIAKPDEDYWKRYRATPKAYIRLDDGQKMWATRFGKLSSVRFKIPEGADPGKTWGEFDIALLAALPPASGGFVVRDIRGPALQASSGSTDFGMLFLGLSLFVIIAALLLVGLLIRLNLERRATEIGILAATGWTPGAIRRLLVGESAILVLGGAAVGLLGAMGYAWLMLRLLAVQWPGGKTLQFLTLHAEPKSFAIGYVSAVVVGLLTVLWALRGYSQLPPRRLLAGETSSSLGTTGPGAVSLWIAIGCLVFAVPSLIAGFVFPAGEEQAGSFFTGGFLMLAGLLAIVWRFLKSGSNDPQPSLLRLGWQNAGRNPTRSLLTVGLLAAATFLIVAMQAFQREPTAEFLERHGGSGGYALFAETQVSVFRSLGDRKILAELGVPPEVAAKVTDIVGLRVEPGDDASCLNLYKPEKPRILGVPSSLIRQGRFAFAGSLAETEAEKKNPWLLLSNVEDGTIPAIIDANSAQWVLHVGLGETLEMKGPDGRPVKLKIVGLLHDSLFQSEMLIGEKAFTDLFPNQSGWQFFLIDAAEPRSVQSALTKALAAEGGQVTPTIDRIAGYLAVENTYLSTFQALGGLGLLLGAVGLSIVLVRGVWERRAELALLRAVGFRGGQLATLVLAENAILLVLGLGVGTLAALAAVLPHLVGTGATVLWGQLAALLTLVAAIGLGSGAAAVLLSLRTPVLTALRRE
jgi:putative ABC transport system permease protein